MGVNNLSARSIYNSRSVWLPAIVIIIFLFSFLHFNTSALVQPENKALEASPGVIQEDDGFESALAKEPLRIYVPPAEIPKDNPHNSVWSADKGKPIEMPTPEDPEAYHKGPPAKEGAPPDPTIPTDNRFPPGICPETPPFDISKCPSVQELASKIDGSVASPGLIQSIDISSRNSRPLVSYAYYETDFGRVNLKFFVMHALHNAADFVFILNGETDVAETIIPMGRPNVRVIKRENTCLDLGAHAEVLSAEEDGQPAYKDRYRRFILMNASIRGPFVPHWSTECWTEAYLGRVNEKVKLVGSSLNCMGGASPHVQSMIWATDSVGLAAILEPEGIGECFDSLDAAIGGEIRTTGHIRSKGFEVDVMLTVYQTEREYQFVNCKNPDDFLYENGYYGFSVHPFETLFIKSHRGIEDNMLEKLSAWVDMSGYSSYEVCQRYDTTVP